MFSFDQVKLGQQLGHFENGGKGKGGMRYYPTGFPALDKQINGGLQPGLTVLGAIPTIGKSTLALQIAETIARSGVPVLFYSLEMDGGWIEAKAVSRHIFEENGLNERGSLSANEVILAGEDRKEQISRVRKEISVCEKSDDGTLELYVITGDGDGPVTAEFIRENVGEFIDSRKERPAAKKPVVFVDYLQLLSPGGQKSYSDNRSRTDAAIEKLVALAHGRKIPVFLISSLNRSSYDRATLMQGFKDTGLIEYSADLLLGLQMYAVHEKGYGSRVLSREMSKSPRDVELVVLKQRYGPCGEDVAVRLDYYPKFNYFCESDGRRAKKSERQASGKSFFINNSLVMKKIRRGDYVPGEENRDVKNKLCFEISEKVDAFDCAIMDAVYTLQYSGETSFRARDIHRLLSADPKSISKDKKEKIEHRIERLAGITFLVEDEGKEEISGALLPIEKLEGKQCKYAFRKGQNMPLYEYASRKRHILRYPQAMLSMKAAEEEGSDTAFRNTEEGVLFKLCLLREINVIRYKLGERPNAGNWRKMKYDTIIEEAIGGDMMHASGLPEAQRRKKRQNNILLIGKILDSYKRMGYIEGYEKYGEGTGIEITGEIADPKELLFKAEIEENSDL